MNKATPSDNGKRCSLVDTSTGRSAGEPHGIVVKAFSASSTLRSESRAISMLQNSSTNVHVWCPSPRSNRSCIPTPHKCTHRALQADPTLSKHRQ